MEAEARYTLVGAGVLALIAALVAAVVWLKNVGGDSEFDRYVIHFEQQALDGLEVGAAVTLRGIKVGRVEDYALSSTLLNRVRVEVRVDRRAAVRTNTVAVVSRNFVTGIAAIALVNRVPAGGPLVEVPAGERVPVIREGKSELDEITGRVTRVGDMAAVALTNVNQLLNAENRTEVLDTVRSLRELADGLSARLDALDGALARIGTAATDVGKGAAELGRSSARVATIVERGAERLELTLSETERTVAHARVALQQIAQASSAVEKQATATARRLEDSATNVDEQLNAAVTELRLSVETATRVIDRLRDPRAALLGPTKSQLGPGETLP